MYKPLAPCPACARHVRVGEPACPFCAAALPADLTASAAPDAGVRLARSALVAFAAAALGAACVREAPDAPPPPQPSSGGGVVQGPLPSPSPAPIPPPRVVPVPDAGGPDDPGSPVAEYGAPAPPRPDAGVPSTAAAYGAAPPQYVVPQPPGPGSVQPLYGVPPRP